MKDLIEALNQTSEERLRLYFLFIVVIIAIILYGIAEIIKAKKK